MKEQGGSTGHFHWIKDLFGPLIVGVVVLVGQIFVNPMVAERVRRKEAILENKHAACNEAIRILQKRLASVSLYGGTVPASYAPPEDSPSQLDINVTYSRLVLYCNEGAVANTFREVVKTRGATQEQVGLFLTQLRKEMMIDGSGVPARDFRYIYGWKQGEGGSSGGTQGQGIN
ncbi:MAG: hypothetical protein JW955_04695 [Sedimentisphaerales bacterium]|nr:hypothetical protein [Sedimentisphaerales bacterium]